MGLGIVLDVPHSQRRKRAILVRTEFVAEAKMAPNSAAIIVSCLEWTFERTNIFLNIQCF